MLSSSGVSLRMDMFFLYFGAKRPNREVFAHGFGVFVHVSPLPARIPILRLASFILAQRPKRPVICHLNSALLTND